MAESLYRVLTFTTPIWFPIVVLTLPIWVSVILGTYISLRITGLWIYVRRSGSNLHKWVLFRSQTGRKYLWKRIYNGLSSHCPDPKWKCMNYGYAATTGDGHTIALKPEDEEERFAYQLYHNIATGFKRQLPLENLDILEVGSGRGGGLSYLARYMSPASATGVDVSSIQVAHCRRNYHSENLHFVEGNAENIPIEDSKIDVVFNIESSHCYSNFNRFISEVDRVLKPGGSFLFTDFRPQTRVAEMEAGLLSASLLIDEKIEITQNAVRASLLDADRRVGIIKEYFPKCNV